MVSFIGPTTTSTMATMPSSWTSEQIARAKTLGWSPDISDAARRSIERQVNGLSTLGSTTSSGTTSTQQAVLDPNYDGAAGNYGLEETPVGPTAPTTQTPAPTSTGGTTTPVTGEQINNALTGGTQNVGTSGGNTDAWQQFYDYAISLGYTPDQINALQGTTGSLPTSFYQNLLPEGMSQADMIRQDLIMDPSYQFRFGEGQRAVERRQNAMGNRFSGAGLAELTRYGQDYASQEYNNAYNRMSSIAGYGPTVGGQMNQVGALYSNQMGNTMQNFGNSSANYNIGMGNIQGQAANAGYYPSYSGWNSIRNIWR